MPESKHTPGPWMVTRGHDRSTISAGSRVVAEVRHPAGPRIAEGNANARLIAAAPAMYGAWQEYLETLNLQPINLFGAELHPDSEAVYKAQRKEMERRKKVRQVALSKARAALAAAKGE